MGTRATDVELTYLPAYELRERVARGDVSAAEVVDAHVRRTQATHGRLNAVVVPLFEQARAQARAADAARERGEVLGPLHGVPVTIKEMFDVADTPTTAGVKRWPGVVAEADGPLVARLRAAGAIVLGKTNVAQAGMMYESDNPLYGRTNNPWDLGRSPGGSSGGEGAALAAGCSALGLGSDGGGSGRHPAHCCGVQVLKPTSGRLSMAGHWTLPNWSPDWVQPAPMARTVADLHLALRVLAAPGQEAFDPRVAPAPLGDPAAVALAGLRVGAYEDDGHFTPSPALRRGVREAAAFLREKGAQVEDFTPPDVPEAVRVYFGLVYHDGMGALKRCLRGGPVDWRIRRVLLGAAMPGLLRPALRSLMGVLGRRYDAQFFSFVRRRKVSVDGYWRLVDEQAAYRRRFL